MFSIYICREGSSGRTGADMLPNLFGVGAKLQLIFYETGTSSRIDDTGSLLP